MSERIASLFVEIGAKLEGLMSGLGQAKRETEAAGSTFKGFTDEVVKGIGFIAAEAAILKQVFDFGDMGAQILQTEQSFQSLLTAVGGAPSTLNDMRSAAQGTISDLQLMSSASTFLAGTTGDLGTAFAEALPGLVGVARAAAILNPTVGSTGEAFQRLALGIKKAEPELLDELGILLNLNQVYQEFAPTIGKTATELTKTEKSMAMLNAVMAQGGTLMAQAATAANESATKIDRMQASVENAGNALKTKFAPFIANAADGIYYMLTGMDQVNDALKTHEAVVRETSGSYSEYINEMNRTAEAVGYSINANGDLVAYLVAVGDGAEKVVQANYAYTESMYMAARSSKDMRYEVDSANIVLGTTSAAMSAAVAAADQLTYTTDEQAASWAAYGERLSGAATSMDELHIMAVALAAGLEGTLGEAMDNYSANLEELTTQEADLTTQLEELQSAGLGPTNAKYQELTEALRQNATAQSEALASLQSLTAETIYQQAAMGLDTQAALDLARSMGVLSESDYAVASAVETLRVQFDKNGDSMIDAAEGAADYAASVELVNRAVQSLQAKGLPVTLDNIASEMGELAKTDAAGELENTGSAANEATPGLQDIANAAAEASETTGDLAGTVDDQNSALEAVQGAANRARGGLQNLKGAVNEVIGPLRSAASSASDLADSLRDIRPNTSIRVTTSGFPEAIGWVDKLSSALNSIPTSVSATVNLSQSQTGGGGAPSTTSGAAPATSQGAAVTVTETYNVYNPLAAAMLIEQKRASTAARAEALMNG